MTSGRVLNDGEEFKVRREGDKYYIHMGKGIHEVPITSFDYRRVFKWLGIATGVYISLNALCAAIITPIFYQICMAGSSSSNSSSNTRKIEPWHVWLALVLGPILSMLPDRE
jgi:hypothetical protein